MVENDHFGAHNLVYMIKVLSYDRATIVVPFLLKFYSYPLGTIIFHIFKKFYKMLYSDLENRLLRGPPKKNNFKKIC